VRFLIIIILILFLYFDNFNLGIMELPRPKVIVFGHSFVKRLYLNIQRASVKLHGIGGRTVDKLIAFNLDKVRSFRPAIVILEIGTNDLSHSKPEVVGSKIDDLVHLLLQLPYVQIVAVCLITHRAAFPEFNGEAFMLNQYLEVVLGCVPNVFCWSHKGFLRRVKSPFLPNGVHFNRRAQYTLYRSYRGAIRKALASLPSCIYYLRLYIFYTFMSPDTV
jgi:lysophospholipase L1-like esterase